ncbi:conserved hypothetical protein [Pediculus humanus corporis]|uniref:C2H2-type domain-containing protein n=1 Tax=Pediculus humanus subsp. corporis TaxID=121224 RepID=E0V910_PEDHC|nr:uncharacterized protein Phum_PHUM003080 [Pediculus humanus corporis]EEB09866.1 conserved hypothetical protein [Pediculus humanus corporis]
MKGDTSSTTNIIVTKYADSNGDIINVEPSLNHLDSKEKVIEVQLLSTNLHHKTNLSALLNGTLEKKNIKHKVVEDDDINKFSQNNIKNISRNSDENNYKQDLNKNNNLTCKPELNLEETVLCGECNKQFASRTLLKKHLSNCKVHSLGAALCSKCGKHFSSNYNLKRHMTSCKLCPDNEKSPRYMCQCGRTYSQEWDMKKHKLKCKDAQLIAHMKKDHNMIIQDPKILNFNSFDEFLIWKEKEEEETFTYYSKQTGSNVSGVSVNTYYVCQHDGSDRTHTSTPRKTERRNKKGRIKTGRLCWSQMNVKQFKDGTVKVTYFPSHTHPVSIADTEHHPLPSSITMEIKRRFSEISKLGETEEFLQDENHDLRKGRRRKYGMSIRTLRALARKNRSLFRITAEAVQKPDGIKNSFDSRQNFQFPCSKEITSANNNNNLQVISPENEENIDDPDAIQIFNVPSENETRNVNDELLQDCINYLNDVKAHLLSGKLQHSVVTQIKESLKNLCDIWKNDTTGDSQLETVKNENLPDCQEVMMYRPQSPLPVTEIFPLQDEVNTSVEVNDFKHLDTSEKAVYQIIAVDNEEKQSNDYEYHNTVEMMGPREFIIIAADNTQLFQSVDPNIQFNLN